MKLCIDHGTSEVDEDFVGGFLSVGQVVVGIFQHTILSEHLVEVLPADVEIALAGTTEASAAIAVANHAGEASRCG